MSSRLMNQPGRLLSAAVLCTALTLPAIAHAESNLGRRFYAAPAADSAKVAEWRKARAERLRQSKEQFDKLPRCKDVGGWEAYHAKTGKACRL